MEFLQRVASQRPPRLLGHRAAARDVQHHARTGGKIERLLIVDDRESIGHESHATLLLFRRALILRQAQDER